MDDVKSIDLDEKDLFIHDVPDEALEAAAFCGPHCGRAFTVAFCTGNLECPF